jgi:photoactive yellow protein
MVDQFFSQPPSTGSYDTSRLDQLRDADLDELGFGVIALDGDGTVLRYNQYESRLARLDRNQVLGRSFFEEVAPCTKTADFEGRFRRYVQEGTTRPERFPYVFDFKFGAQEVTVELVRPSALERYYLLINRVRVAAPRPEGRPAPLQAELSPGEAELGVRRDAAEQRVVQLPSVFFTGLRATCERLAPQTWPMFCHDWGLEWGRRAAIDLEARVFESEGKSLHELSMRRVASVLDGWFKEQGLGSSILDFSFSKEGCLVVELQRSALSEAALAASREREGEATERCALVAGCLSALLSHVGGRRLAAREVRCGVGTPALCSFLVVGHARRAQMDALLAAGERDVRGLVQRLASTERGGS